MSSATVTVVLACSVGDKERPVSSWCTGLSPKTKSPQAPPTQRPCSWDDRLPSGLLPGWWGGARGMAEVSAWDQSASHRWALKRQQEGASLGAQVHRGSGWGVVQDSGPGSWSSPFSGCLSSAV